MRRFRHRTKQALADETLQRALDQNAARRMEATRQALQTMADPDGSTKRAREIRHEVVEQLDDYRDRFIRNAEEAGFILHHAQDGEQACARVLEIANEHEVDLIAKSKSMVTEEIHLNRALERAGHRVVETDLGEFIVQLRGEPPAHIITPALHLLAEQVAETFRDKLGMKYSPEVKELTSYARRELRQVFLRASMGISGVNFGVAESGALCLVTNEGNGRMVTTLPPVHVAVMGVERIVPTYQDLEVMLRVLPRSATGQALSAYVTLMLGPRHANELDGPRERHLVLVDNGRLEMRASRMREALMCIRCGACLNACPVFREIGGHAYDSPYPGPIGSIVSPGLFGLSEYGHLATASTLCGACSDACPVGIDLPSLLLRTRAESPSEGVWPLRLFAWLATNPKLFRAAQRLAASIVPSHRGWLDRLPPPLNRWTASRQFPPFARVPFRERVRSLDLDAGSAAEGVEIRERQVAMPAPEPVGDPMETFLASLSKLGAQTMRCTPDLIGRSLGQIVKRRGLRYVLVEKDLDGSEVRSLEDSGVRLAVAELPHAGDSTAAMQGFAQAEAGITLAAAALADTGTLVFPAGAGRSQLASLLPPIHIAILREESIHASMQAWMQHESFHSQLRGHSLVFVTGPSCTSDIEMSLTVGVHGPEQLIVLCVG